MLYLDESGSRQSDHFVAGGLAVHEQDAHHLARAVDRLFSELPPSVAGAELHAQHIRAGKKGWRSIDKEVRRQLHADVSDLLTTTPRGGRQAPVLFAVTIHKPSFPQHNPFERAYEEFFARCNGFLGRLASRGDRHRCVAIADKTGLEPLLQDFMRSWRTQGASTGASIGPMSAYAEVPLFVDSTASRLVQLADFVAHWVYRAYEAGDETVLDGLLAGFDSSGGTLHGLVHLVDRYWECSCAACSSRR